MARGKRKSAREYRRQALPPRQANTGGISPAKRIKTQQKEAALTHLGGPKGGSPCEATSTPRQKAATFGGLALGALLYLGIAGQYSAGYLPFSPSLAGPGNGLNSLILAVNTMPGTQDLADYPIIDLPRQSTEAIANIVFPPPAGTQFAIVGNKRVDMRGRVKVSIPGRPTAAAAEQQYFEQNVIIESLKEHKRISITTISHPWDTGVTTTRVLEACLYFVLGASLLWFGRDRVTLWLGWFAFVLPLTFLSWSFNTPLPFNRLGYFVLSLVASALAYVFQFEFVTAVSVEVAKVRLILTAYLRWALYVLLSLETIWFGGVAIAPIFSHGFILSPPPWVNMPVRAVGIAVALLSVAPIIIASAAAKRLPPRAEVALIGGILFFGFAEIISSVTPAGNSLSTDYASSIFRLLAFVAFAFVSYRRTLHVLSNWRASVSLLLIFATLFLGWAESRTAEALRPYLDGPFYLALGYLLGLLIDYILARIRRFEEAHNH